MTHNKNDLSNLIDNEIGYIVLINGMDEDNKEMWYYVSIAPSKLEAFKQAEEAGDYDIADYGEIITAGEGHEPSAEVQKEMAETYGTSDEFEKVYDQVVKGLSQLKI